MVKVRSYGSSGVEFDETAISIDDDMLGDGRMAAFLRYGSGTYQDWGPVQFNG